MSALAISEKIDAGPAREPGGRHRHPGLVLELGPVERGQLHRVGEVEQPRDEIHLLVVDTQPALQPLEQVGRDRVGYLDAHDVAEAPAVQFELHRLEQVVRLVVDLEVGVPRQPEGRALADLHLGEERFEEVGDDILERQEEAACAHLDEPGQPLRHLDAGEPLLPGLGVADEDPEAERERGDVGERLARPRRRAASAPDRSPAGNGR